MNTVLKLLSSTKVEGYLVQLRNCPFIKKGLCTTESFGISFTIMKHEYFS